MDKEYIKQEIMRCYEEEDVISLAHRLQLAVGTLRRKAGRLNVRKHTKSNKITDGYKLCSRCKQVKTVSSFRHDSAQPNNLDYNCIACRKNPKPVIPVETENKTVSMAFGKKKTRNPVLDVGGTLCLKCKRCEKIKSLDSFHADAKAKSGRKNFCKECLYKKKKGLI